MQLDHLPRSAKSFLEPLVVERLDQVVDGGEVEGSDGVIVGGGEDDRRHVVRADVADHLESGFSGHLDIEEDEIRLQLANRRNRRQSIVGSAHDLDVVFVREQILEPLAGQALVVSDKDAQRLGGSH